MRCRLQRFALTKAVRLTISRGGTAAVEHLLLELEHDGSTGLGECGGLDTGHRRYDTEAIAAELQALQPEPRQAFEPLLAGLSPLARCAIDDHRVAGNVADRIKADRVEGISRGLQADLACL